jgi:cephalosporin hydroxylase
VEHPRIVQVTGDSSSSGVVERVTELCRGKRVLVMHDGDHHKEHVLRDLECYAGLVSPGSYFIVEDGIVDLFEPGDGLGWHPDGPLAAVEEFLAGNDEFVVDESRERYLLTYNPRGYLKKVADANG